jgi:hypothetical protein
LELAWGQMLHLHFQTFSGIEHANPSCLALGTKMANRARSP